MAFRERIQAAIFGKETAEAIQASIIHPTVRTGPVISTGTQNDNRGNQFGEYNQLVREIEKRWRSEAQYGNAITRMIINYRTGWIAGNGASIEGKTQSESKWLQGFVKKNKLDNYNLSRYVRNGEIEGRALLYLDSEKTDEGYDIVVKLIRWIKFQYSVNTDEMDDQKILNIAFKDSKGETVTLAPDTFVYVNLDNSGTDINKPIPAINGSTLSYIINMDKSLADWRSFNHRFGNIPLHYEAQDASAAMAFKKAIEEKGSWKLGDTVVAPVKAYFPAPPAQSKESLESEIAQYARIISGDSGVPIHLMGWAREMSNRATAEELREMVTAHTAEPRDIWKESIIELSEKAIEMHNRLTGETKSSEVDVHLAQVSRDQIKELIDVWLPLNEADKISDETFMAKIPGVDVKQEQKRIQKQKEDGMENQARMITTMRALPQREEEDEGQEPDENVG